MVSEKKFSRKPAPRIYSPTDLGKKWFVEIYDAEGRKRIYGEINKEKTYAGRMKAAKALQSAIEKDVAPPIKTPKDKEAALAWMQVQGWRPKSYSTHLTIVNAWFDFLGPRKGTNELAVIFFKNLQFTRNPTTYNKYLQLLNAILVGIGSPHICEGIKTLRQNPTPARYFQKFQIKKLSSAIQAKDPQLWTFVQFLYYCFVRPRELVFLRAGNVLLESEQIYIPGEVSKNKKSEYVSIPKAFLPSLQYILDLPPERLLFPSPQDITKPLGFDKMYRRHQKILKENGFGKGYVLYSWKHTGAVQAVKAGITLKELQIQLRHHSLDQVDQYLRQMGVWDLVNLQENFPAI
ncbi:tyrosine-type recombinase/integrase [Haliscomenobacter hydrossis]|uniref:Integrase family protein n=1 Tax=Haliscomenobacter hydrossis (strain ATCC 27775 / DSM 1100 / LMG 10767 / O) TaxID=760192 RepID=F4KZ62_HALH1|nr:site-specific integrase [Haliscomenobacter hydrossis]AEE53716.1 integrase family protein [Haliscomenobacter hydrossis DSM 1100]